MTLRGGGGATLHGAEGSRVHPPHGVASARAVPRLSSPLLVGREHELARLLEILGGPPGLVVIEGEAGVGKSRLVEEALAAPRLGDRIHLIAHSQNLRDTFPLGVLLDALRGVGDRLAGAHLSPLVGVLRPLLPDLGDLLPPAPASTRDAQIDRHLLFRAMAELLDCLGPAICVLEDLHWVHEGTAEFLHHLLTVMPPHLTVVVTYRREDLPATSPLLTLATRRDRGLTTAKIELVPFDRRQVRELVSRLLDSEMVTEEFAGYVFDRTAGLPFAVEEVVRLIYDRRDLLVSDERWFLRAAATVVVPAAIKDAILARCSGLGSGPRAVAEAAAVLGEPSSEALLTELAGLTPARGAQALSAALAAAVLFELSPGGYGFRHALACQAVHEAMPGPTRRRLHLAAARLVRRTEPARFVRLAHHYRHAGRPRDWVRNAERAADMAALSGNHESAAALLDEALDAPGVSIATRGRLAVKLGSSAWWGMARRPEAIERIRSIIDDAELPIGIRGEARYYLGELLATVDTEAGRQELRRAVSELQRRPELAARAMRSLGWPFGAQGHISEHLEWLERAAALAARVDDPTCRIEVLAGRAVTRLWVGDPEAWSLIRALPWDSSLPVEKQRLMWVAAQVAGGCLHTGHLVEARTFLDDATARADELDHHLFLSQSQGIRLALDWQTGIREGIAARAALLDDGADPPSLRSLLPRLVLGDLALEDGRIGEAARCFQSCIGSTRQTLNVASWMAAMVGLARTHLQQGRPQAAHDLAAEVVQLVSTKGLVGWAADAVRVLVEALIAMDRAVEAGPLLVRLEVSLEGRDAPGPAAVAGLCRGLVSRADGHLEAAAAELLRAAQALAALPRPAEAAQAEEARGLCLVEAGDEAAGVEALCAALGRFEALGVLGSAARVRRSLRDRSVQVASPFRAGRRGHGTVLTAREREVAALAAQGLTNAQIGSRIFVSPRTVEQHVASAMRKLRAPTKAALAAAWSALPEGRWG